MKEPTKKASALRPASWPVSPVSEHNPTPILDDATLVTQAQAKLPDETWVPLLAATLAFKNLGRAERTALAAALTREKIAGADGLKKLTPAKGLAWAKAAKLDLALFVQAMVVIDSGTLTDAALALGEEPLFAAIADWRSIEWFPGKSLPAGLGQVKALEFLRLRKPGKLASRANVDELGALPNAVTLELEFEGKPPFACPDLALLTGGGFGALRFKTTGTPVTLTVDALAPLAAWPRLTFLALRDTELARPTAEQLAAIRKTVPRATTLHVSEEPAGWKQAMAGGELLVGSAAEPAK